MPDESQTEPETTRRGFYIAAINALGAIIGAAVALPAAAYLLIKPKSGADEGLSEVGSLDELKVGKPQEVLYERNRVDGWHKVKRKRRLRGW